MDPCFVVYPAHGCVFGFHLRYNDTHIRLPGGYRAEWTQMEDLSSVLVERYACSPQQVTTILRLLADQFPFAILHTNGEYSLTEEDSNTE